jgi:excisionase family DNA binding protein
MTGRVKGSATAWGDSSPNSSGNRQGPRAAARPTGRACRLAWGSCVPKVWVPVSARPSKIVLDPPPGPVSLAEADEIVGVHPRVVRRWAAQGYLTGHRFGPRLIRVDRAELASVRSLSPAGLGRA